MNALERPSWHEVWMRCAIEIGKRSRCSRAEVGCVLVSKDNRVVSQSYVGPPPAFTPADDLAAAAGMAAEWRFHVDDAPYPTDCRSWCPRSQPGHEPQEGYVDCVSSHAEMNAIARADYSLLSDGTAYVNGAVCLTCAKLLAAAGVKRVCMIVREAEGFRNPDRTIEYLKMNNITVLVFDALKFEEGEE